MDCGEPVTLRSLPRPAPFDRSTPKSSPESMMRRRSDPPRRKLLLRQLEERLLFTAVPLFASDLLDVGAESSSASEEFNELVAAEQLDGDQVNEDQRASLHEPMRRELVIIDSKVDDHESLLIQLGEDPSRELLLLVLDDTSDTIQQIDSYLAGQTGLDAIHILSHGNDAKLRLGDTTITSDNISAVAGSLAGWANSLSTDADILLYGCDIASSEAGRELADSIAALTDADVAASDDLTGHSSLGGDWTLEYATGSIETDIAPSTAARSTFVNVLADAAPSVTVAITGDAQPGSNTTIHLSFDNTGLPGDTGFGPFIDVLIPKLGADGVYDGDLTGDGSLYDLSDVAPADGQADGEPDGLILPVGLTVNYQGLDLNSFLFTFGDDDGAGAGTTGTIAHPFAVDSSGNPLNVVGQSGDQLLVIELPFGSFATDQPAIDLSISAPISPLADIGTPLTIFARGGFRYGNDAFDNPTTDPSLLSDTAIDATTWSQSASVTPSALVVTTTTSENGEGATGPNWLQTFTFDVDIPTGQVLSNFVLTDALPDNIQFSQITSVSVGGAANSGVNFTTNVNDTDGITNFYGQDEIAAAAGVAFDASLVGTYGSVDPTGPQASGTLAIVADGVITGYAGTDITVTVTYFVPDQDAAGDWVLGGNAANADKGEDDPNSPEVSNTVTVTGSIAAADLRDTGGVVSENSTATLDTKSIALQKSVSVVGGGDPSPGKLLEWSLSFQLSDYYSYGNLVIDDIFSDGQVFFSDAVHKATFSITDRGVTRGGDLVFGYGSVAAAFDGTNTLVVDESRRDTSDGGFGAGTSGEVTSTSSDGQTELKIFLSEALQGVGDDGIMEGDLADNGVYDGQSATGTITFYTEIQEEFIDPVAGEDRSVDQGDAMLNHATLTADNRVNRVDNALMPSSGHSESDDASASTTIPPGSLTKQLYAINGDIGVSADLNISAGDRVTYRLTYHLPTTDFEDLVLTDFFPLPAFEVSDPDADGYSPANPNDAWVFDANTTTTTMRSGVVELLGSDTFYDVWDAADGGGLDDSAMPILTVDTNSNSLSIDFGTFDGSLNDQTQIDLLVTVTVGDTQFADGLFLTNMAQASEASTGGSPSSNVDLTQIQLSAPDLVITKGIVSTNVDGVANYTTSSVANELQVISGSAGGVFTLTFQGETTAAVSATATIDEVRVALEGLSNVESGDVIVSGSSIGSGSMLLAFIGQYEATDITLSVSDAGLTATQALAGGSPITAGSLAGTWGLPGASANTAAIDPAVLAALPLDQDVDGLDALDQVKFAVTIRNVGDADAYDISITDLLPTGMEVASGGLNLQVYDANGNELSWTALGADPLVDGIRIHDPIAVYTWADDGTDRLVRMDSRDNFDSASNASFVGAAPSGIGSIEAMALDPNSGTLYAIDEDYLGTINLSTGAFTAFSDRIDADLAITISDVDAMSFDPVTGELWGVDSVGNELIKIDTSTGKAITNAFGSNDYLVVPGGGIDDIAIDFSGDIFASAASQLESITINSSTWAVTRSLIGTFDFGATNLNDMEGISVDQNGRLWGTTGNNDASIYDNRIWEIDKETGDASNPRALTVGGDFESVVAFDPNASGSAAQAGYQRDTLVITYDVQLASDSTADTTYINNAVLGAYSSMDGGDNFVTGTVNATAQITTAELSLDTFTVDSSEAHTVVDGSGVTDGVIGEIVRYRVELVLPEGSYNDLTLREILPTGLTFIDDGTAQIAFVSDNGAITSTDVSDAAAFVSGNETSIAGLTPGGDFGDEDVSNSLNGSDDAFGSGSDVYFRLGDVVNADNDANVEYVILEFNAIVDNDASNDAGDVRSHRSRLYVDDVTHVTTTIQANDQVRVVEPELNVDSRVFSIAQVDGGDVFNVTVTISATSGIDYADAFDLNFTESMPTGFTRTGAVSVSGGSFTPVVIDNSTATQVDLVISSLPEGDTITVVYSVTADDDLAVAGTHSFAGDLTWTSLTGASGTSGGGDPTGSDPPGASGAINGERTGDDSALAQNDYQLTDSDNLAGRTIPLTKTLVGTEFANDIDVDGIDNQAVIGELVTYRLQMDIPEGEATGLVVVDTLDAGLAFVGLTSVTVGDDIAHVGGAAITTSSITTTVTSNGQVVTFDIGDVLDPTPQTGNDIDELWIEYQVVVLDVAGNQGGLSETNTLLNNSAVLSYDAGSDVSTSAPELEVIEPALTTTLDVYGAGGSGDTIIEAGESITAVFELKNESGVDAFDVASFFTLMRLFDGSTAIENGGSPGSAPTLTVVDSAGIYNAADFHWVDPDNISSPGSDGQGWELRAINPAGFDIDGADPSRTITFTVTGNAVSGIDSGVVYETTAGATFTSLDGVAANRSSYNADSDERTFDASGSKPEDDYRSIQTANTTVTEPSITKSLTDTEVNGSGNDDTQAVIGELLTYTIVVALPQGDTHDLVITDNLDVGLAFVGMVSGSAPTTVSGDGKTVTWDFGDIFNDPGTTADDTITLVYQTVVLNDALNDPGTLIGESATSVATLDYNRPDGSPATQHSDDTTDQVVTIVEPTITVTRDAFIGGSSGTTTGDAGDTVTYVLTLTNSSGVDAFDLTIFDQLLPLATSSAIASPTFIVTGTSTATAADFQWVAGSSDSTNWALETIASSDLDLLAGQSLTITIDGTLSDQVLTGLNVTDDVTVTWTSIDDDLTSDDTSTARSVYNAAGTERTGGDGAGGAIDDFADESSEFVTINYSTLTKTLVSTSLTETGLTRPGGPSAGDDPALEDVAIGEYITYHVTYTAAEGISDDLVIADITYDASGQVLEILSASIINIGGNLSFADDSGTPIDFTGATDSNSSRLSLSDILLSDGVTDYLVADMGDVSNVSDGVVDANDQFVIEVVARAVDVAANQNDTLALEQHADNIAWYSANNPNAAGAYTYPFQGVSVEVVTPELTLTKSIDKTIVDTGETVTVTLTATNIGNASAYQVQITDILSASDFDLSSVNVGVSGTDYPADFTANYTAGTGTLVYDFGQLDAGESATFVFTVNVADNATAGETIENLGSITFASTLPGGHANEADARTYGDANAIDDTALDDTDSFTVRENSISGYVYLDADQSDTFNAGDTGLASVTLTLSGSDHLGNAITPIVVTTADGMGADPLGYYEFTGLAAGNYTLTQTQAAGYLDGNETLGAAATLAGSSPVHDVITFAIPTGTETASTGNHFGELSPGQIVGYVYNDSDLDGNYGGAGGIEDVTVTITYTDDRSAGATQSVTTDSNGRFLFADLRPGTYTITVDSGDADLLGLLNGIERDDHNSIDSATDYVIGSFSLAQGETEDDKWFGFHQAGTIAGFVYHDANNDGVKDVGESGISGSQVRLTGTTFEGDIVTATIDVTDVAGFYEFTGLLPGDYDVQQIVPPAGYLDGRDTAGDAAANTLTNELIANIVLSDGESSTGNLFGELVPATLSGVVFNDFDGNGVQNGLETGVANVTLTLNGNEVLPDGSTAAITPIVITTAADGTYSFTNLRPGTYTITQTQPSEYTDGTDTAGNLGGNTSVDDVISSIIVMSDDDGTGYNFAELGASITGTVFRDDDRDGVFDGGEPGIQGVTVELYESDGTTLITTTMTAVDGSYAFEDLAAGNYIVREVQPNQYTSSPAADTNSRSVTLVAGTDNTGNHFGEAAWDLSGRVWFDRDAEGDDDVAEHGFDDVLVTLTYAGDDGNLATTGDNITYTTRTDANGDYTFTELFNGNYRVTIETDDLPEGVTNTVDPDGGIASQSELSISGGDIADHDFGYLGAGVISDQIWLDVDGDGIYESLTEPGIPDITVHIVFAGDDGLFGTTDDMTWTDVTDSSGHYGFANLPDGNFRVFVDTADADFPGSVTEVTVGDSNFGTVNVTLHAGDRIADDTDFGFVGQRTIGDVVWFDANGNGIQDVGEAGLGGVTLQLQRTGPSNTFTVTTTTAADGTYTFDKLPEGNYVLTAIAGLPTDATVTHDVDGTDDGTANFSLGTTDRNDIDFGYRGSGANGATISNFVWYDQNGDGVQDGGEPGIFNATVTLFYAGGDGDFSTTADNFTLTDSTDVNGLYGFANLFAGNYRISVSSVPGGLSQTYHVDDGVGSIAEVSEISVTADQDRTDIDFGYRGSFSAAGQVWLDRNANDTGGEANEPGIGGVTVELTYAGSDGVFSTADDLVITTVTDASGNYSIGDLGNGDYRVRAIAGLPDGTTATSGGGAPPDGIVDFSISGSDVTDRDLGFVGTRTIGNRVWFDIDGDGAQDAGEPGIENVGLTIVYHGADGNAATALDNLTFNVVTGTDGQWSIDGLSDGDYSITVTTADLPANLDVLTHETDDFLIANDNVAHVRIEAADPLVRTDIDFGYTGNQTIGSKVWLDLDADGVIDTDEVGLGGVEVTVVWSGFDNDLATTADNITYVTVTDANGDYAISRLPDGNYAVSIDTADLPSGMTQTFEVDGTPDNHAALTLGGSGNSGVNFGYRGTSVIGDLIYLDGEGDGLQSGQDRGLTNVDVTLTYLGTDGLANGDASEFLLSGTSGAFGAYTFANLPGGNFVVTVNTADASLPADVTIVGDGVGNAIGNSEAVTLANGETNNDLDFAFVGTRTIGDRVWYDVNDNGVDDAGEPGIHGVDLLLTFAGQDDVFGSADDLTFATTTTAGGAYSFENVAGGNYRLSVDTASLPNTMRSTFEINDGLDSLANTAEFAVSGVDRADIDFGYTGDGVIGDQLWLDVNGDGFYDSASEPGLANVTVTVVYAGDDGDFSITNDNWTFTTSTDATGNYSFDHLPDGEFRVFVDTSDSDLPAGIAEVTVGNSNSGVVNITLDGTDRIADEVDFGFVGQRTISDLVWFDIDGDGIKGANEPGLGGVTIQLQRVGPNGTFTVTTTTAGDGTYSVDKLPEGNYVVTAIAGLPIDATATHDVDATNDGTANFAIGATNRTDIDFGYRGSGTDGATISDFVWYDYNGDGVQDPDEPGLGGATVTLEFAGGDGDFSTSADNFSLTTTTLTSGIYSFTNLFAGDYRVSVSGLPGGSTQSIHTDDGPGTIAEVSEITVVADQDRTEIDFGYVGGHSASGQVWLDTNSNDVNGEQNEPGLGGVTVTLIYAGSDGDFGTSADNLTLSTVTDAAGNYSFSGLIDGDYRVESTSGLPVGTTPTSGGGGPADGIVDFTLAGGDVSDIDLGYRGAGTIGDFVFLDYDNDSSQAGSIGLADIGVTLTYFGIDGIENGDASEFTLSIDTADGLGMDALGSYLFANLPTGTFRVSVDNADADLPGSIVTFAAAGQSVQDTTTVTLTSAVDDATDIDFGFQGQRTIGDRVWLDDNEDGIQNATVNEQGLNGVDLVLVFAGQDGNFSTTHDNFTLNYNDTVGDGNFTTSGLVDGDYRLSVSTSSLPTGFTPTHDVDGTADGTANFTISGIDRSDIDFGFSSSAEIGDFVWIDSDGDGLQDVANEPGLAGITVYLQYAGVDGVFEDPSAASSDDTLQIRVTDSAGSYLFDNVATDGLFRVWIDPTDPNLPAGLVPTVGAESINLVTGGGSQPDYGEVTMTAGLANQDADFGFVGQRTLGDRVWFDSDGDGNQAPTGEPGIIGATVQLIYAGQDGDLSTTADNIVMTTTTGVDGDYQFDLLPEGVYQIAVTNGLPMQMDATHSADDASGQPVSATDGVAYVVLGSSSRSDVDLGFRGGSSLSDFVWLDVNGDGVQDSGEPGLAGITVRATLSDQETGGNTFTLETVTDSNGQYSFDFLPPGDWEVTVDLSDPDLPGNLTAVAGTESISGTASVTLGINSSNPNIDFGFRGTQALDGTLWLDRDGDGVIDPTNEPGLGNVTVQLQSSGQDGIFGNADDFTVDTVTDADGDYAFTLLPDGDYRITATAGLPTGMTPTTITTVGGADGILDTTLTGTGAANQNLGFRGTAAISDLIYVDGDADGIQDIGTSDSPLGAITVTATYTGADGIIDADAEEFTLTLETDANGNYLFDSLPGGTYVVAVDTADPQLPGCLTSVVGPQSLLSPTTITLASGETNSDIDFAFQGDLQIDGRLWLDVDGDGVEDPAGEPGLGGVVVELAYDVTDPTTGITEVFTLTTITDTDGNYTFDRLPNGDYTIRPITNLPTGLNPTNSAAGSTSVTLSGSDIADVDLGFRGDASIGDLVWLDGDGDGVQSGSGSDPGLAGIQVTLEYLGTDGVANGDVSEFTLVLDTGADGSYLFNRLPRGTFTLTVDSTDVDLPGSLVTFASAESIDATTTLALPVAGVASRNDIDFGFRGTQTATGRIWLDRNSDALEGLLQDEPSLFGVEVTLLFAGQDGVFGNADDVTRTALTDINGEYLFDALADGDYRAVPSAGTLPSAVSVTHDPDGTPDGTGNFSISGAPASDVDFGYVGSGLISDRIWYDLNGDGLQDSGEVGIPNQSVEVVFAGADDVFGSSDDLTFTTVTDAAGLYSFSALPDGNYRVRVLTPPVGTVITSERDDAADTLSGVAEIVLSASPNRNDIDFGFTGTGDVAGTIWFDYDGDGINDADEPGIPGIDVQLEIDIDGDGTVDQTLTQTVADDGTYAWTNLPAGSFTVTVLTPPSGSTQTYDTDGTSTQHTSDFVVPAGGSAADQSFGYTGTGSIAGHIIYDVNDDGVENAGDRGQGGVDVTLQIDLDGDTVTDLTRTITSAADGSYSFANLIAGIYTVSVDPATLPDSIGDRPTFDHDGHVATPNAGITVLGPGTSAIDRDFGYHGSPDLSVTITDMLTSVGTGQGITYTIDIENLGTSRATGSELVVSLPTSVLENIASTDPLAVVDVAGGTITFLLGEIGEGATLTKTVTAKVLDAIAAGIDDVDVGVTISDDGLHGVDDNSINNVNTDSDIVDAVPDMRTEITSFPPVVTPSDALTYTVTLHNDGNQGATGVQGKTIIDTSILDPATVVFEDSIGNPIPPADITFNHATGEITWDAGTVAAGGQATLIIRGTVFDPVTTLTTHFQIDVTACDDGTNGEDPTDANDGPLDNNHQSLQTVLDATPDYFVDVEIQAPGSHTFRPTDTVTFTITAGNLGNQNGDNVEVITTLPSLLIDPSSVTIVGAGAAYDPMTGEITWHMGSVTGRGTDIRTITVMATIPLTTGEPTSDRIEFSSLVFDDGANGPDLIVPNNQDTDGREFLLYAFDANNSFMQSTGFDDGVDWYGYRDQPLRNTHPLPVDPIYSGLAEPGTTLALKIYDETGREIGSRTVMADAGGNWVASFPGTVIWENPNAMTVETVSALNTLDDESQYNTRRYFQPALHPSMFFAPRPTVQSVIQDAPSRVLAAIHDANVRPLQFGAANHSYDMNVSSNSTAGR